MQVVGHRKRRGGLAQWACDPHCQANVLAAPRDRSLQTGQGTVLDSSGQPCGPIVSPTVLAPAVPRLCPLWPVPALRSSAKRGQRERRGRKGAEEGSFVLSAPVCQSGRSGLPVTCRSSRLSDRSPKKQLSGGLPCFPDPGRQALLHGFFPDSCRTNQSCPSSPVPFSQKAHDLVLSYPNEQGPCDFRRPGSKWAFCLFAPPQAHRKDKDPRWRQLLAERFCRKPFSRSGRESPVVRRGSFKGVVP